MMDPRAVLGRIRSTGRKIHQVYGHLWIRADEVIVSSDALLTAPILLADIVP